MRKVVVALVLSAVISGWAVFAVLPVLGIQGGGGVVVMEDPRPHDVWD